MEILLEIIKILIPSGMVLLATYLVIKQLMTQEQKKLEAEIKMNRAKEITPIRLQAYERMILFLERISPNNLMVRLTKRGMSAKELQAEINQTIRSEFEHNLAQQIYISPAAWEMVKNAKAEMIKFVNIAEANLSVNANAFDLSKKVLERSSEISNFPTKMAIDFIKKELRKTF